ncbi:MAG: Gfo/Idh/MocA family protein [Gammaproteobacteria bacterium]
MNGARAPATVGADYRPRLGFLGVGWIGRHRLNAVAENGCAQIVSIGDENAEAATQAAAGIPQANVCSSLDALLATRPDGVVIATPSGLHAQQAIASLEAGAAVFCQKPLARTATETRTVVEAARRADRLLAVDFCYRHVNGVPRLRELIREGELGQIYALDLIFHNAYGPDKAWFYNRAQSGGGCVMDLGIHLIDLALSVLDYPDVVHVESRLYAQGALLDNATRQLEDYAVAQIEFNTGATARLACSWRLPAGCDAVFEASFYGAKGGATIRNVNGSFYDFEVQRLRGNARETLGTFPDDWGGRAVLAWAQRLGHNRHFDAQATQLTEIARIVDAIYIN